MATEIRMPQLAADMTEADLLAWLVGPGDKVEAGDVILELETDKATVELEAPASGILAEIRVPAGQQGVAVGEVLGVIEAAEGTVDPAPEAPPSVADPASEPAVEPAAETDSAPPIPAPAAATTPSAPQEAATPEPATGSQTPATALARRLAERSGVALDAVDGTGARGRITREDVERSLGTSPLETSRTERGDESIPHTRMRRTIAERLTAAKQTIPHFYLHVDCGADAIWQARSELNALEPDPPITLNDFVIRASALALAEVPAANASWTDDATVRHAGIDISVAVATDGGLVTPIIRDADQKGLLVIAREMRDLASRARAGKLAPREYQGGGFTVSSLGMYGIDSVYPIVNPPQSCILGVGAAAERPIARQGELAVGRVMTLTLSADHRVVDGAVGAALLTAIRRLLEAPLDMLL